MCWRRTRTPRGCGRRADRVVKDTLIYLVIAVAIIYIPIKLGGFDEIFSRASEAYSQTNRPRALRAVRWYRARRASGRTPRWRSARRSRCSCTALDPATLSSRSREVIRRNPRS
ncbi:hypothetical protein GCM10023238_20780 [Streptomyces heliomycini]